MHERDPEVRRVAHHDDAVPVVALGASAGGLESLERFFSNLPAAPGMAFVIIQHLSPDFRSMMDELLARYTRLRIRRAEDGLPIERDTVYVMPPAKDMIVANRRLRLADKDPAQPLSLPIDHFFRSLAHDCGSNCAAVILSGSGSDGSRGIVDVSKAGGLVIAESDQTAKFDGMPGSARRTGVVDLVLPPEEMPQALLQRVGRASPVAPVETQDDVPDGVHTIFELLHREYEIDFSHYKTATVARRIDRRLVIAQAPDLESYAASLREDPAELEALYKDLLIGVTRFFRDPECFAYLENEVIPAMLAAKRPHEELRMWVAGCATGEEAYSLAILLHEAASRIGGAPQIKLFATDVNTRLLEIASQGIFDAERLTDVSPERLQRYFVPHERGYQVVGPLRQSIVFAAHNLLRDAPFTNLDLISCRNLLIYLQPHAQKKALLLFHFGLRAGGVMFLGPSETPGELSDEFDPIEGHYRIYRKRRDVRLSTDFRLSTPAGMTSALRSRLKLASPRPTPDAALLSVYDRLLDRFMPPALLVNEQRELIDSFGRAERFLRVRSRRPSTDVLDMLDPGLRIPLFSLFQHAGKQEGRTQLAPLMVVTDKGAEQVKIGIEPVRPPRTGILHYLITFEPAEPSVPIADQLVEPAAMSDHHMRLLEDELHFTKENLQATIEELETSNEELQATNEELVASNEELQSTNEELHSVNEELYTVNAEHQRKIQELSELNRDMKHLLEATDVAILFLDSELRVRRFTPRVAQVFDLLDSDVGRRISSFTSTLEFEQLFDEIKRVLEDGVPQLHEVRDRDGASYLLRLAPYVVDDSVAGVVVSLVDITGIVKAREHLSRLSAIVESTDDAIVGTDGEGTIVSWNSAAEKLLGFDATEALHHDYLLPVPPERRHEAAEVLQRVLRGERVEHFETIRARKDGRRIYVSIRVSPVLDDQGHVTGTSTIARDVSARKQIEQRQILEHAIAKIAAEASTWNEALPKLIDAFRQHAAIVQAVLYEPAHAPQPTLVCVGSTHGAEPMDLYVFAAREALQTKQVVSRSIVPGTGQARDGRSSPAMLHAVPVMEDHECVLVISVETLEHVVPDPLLEMLAVVAQTIGQLRRRTRAEAELRAAVTRRDQFLAMLSHELRNPLAAVRNATLAIQRPDAEAPQRLNATGVIARQVQHMSHLLDDLLDVARLTQDRLTLQRGPMVVGNAVAAAVEMVEPLARERRIEVAVTGDARDLVINGDATRVSQMLANLLTNGIKYSPPGSRVVVTTERDADCAVLRVRDRGAGMSPEVLGRIFDLFYQADETIDRRTSGMGVGLTLARRLAELHGGTLEAFSEGPARGSEFVVRLPLEFAAESAPRDERRAPAAAGARDVIVIEDHEDNREMIRMLLAFDGHRVHTAKDGVEGVSMIERLRPDVALIDIGLPGLDGYGVAREIRGKPELNGVALVALSGYARASDIEQAVEAGFDDHVAKPVTFERLCAVVQAACERRTSNGSTA